MTSFEALGLSAPVLRALEKHDFTTPTQIQAGAIPPLLEGHDLIGLAETGTGKTAAFVLPMLDRLNAAPISLKAGAPRALILAPTRELALQIGDAFNMLNSGTRLRAGVVYGGAPMHKQLKALKAGVDVLIATPGRLMDHVRRGSVRFDETEIFILDEADRMLDMGFVNDVKTISKSLPTPHQTILFSATINKSVEGLTKILLNEPVRVDLARKASVSEQVEHCVMHLKTDDKKTLLKQILSNDQDGQTIIFTKTKRGADRLSRDLSNAGHKTDAIHGDRNQRQRQRTLTRFRSGSVDILIATDVAARGIDIPSITRVINFDLPLEAESYVHRVGRTGRNGATGIALSLCSPDDVGLLRDIERFIKQSITIDADHEFHIDPPARGAKPQRRKGRARPPRRFNQDRAPSRHEGQNERRGPKRNANTSHNNSHSANHEQNANSQRSAHAKRQAHGAKPDGEMRRRENSDAKPNGEQTGRVKRPHRKGPKPTAHGDHAQGSSSRGPNAQRPNGKRPNGKRPAAGGKPSGPSENATRAKKNGALASNAKPNKNGKPRAGETQKPARKHGKPSAGNKDAGGPKKFAKPAKAKKRSPNRGANRDRRAA